jgi:hypothetical protein
MDKVNRKNSRAVLMLNKYQLGGKQIVYFLIKEMVALDGKLSNRYFSLNTLKV